MLTVDRMAYARSRQAELARVASDARLARMARPRPQPVDSRRRPTLHRLTAHLQLKPAAPAACCC